MPDSVPSLINVLYLGNPNADSLALSILQNDANLNITPHLADNEDAFRAALINFKPDIIIADNDLSVLNAEKALAIVNQTGINTPVIVVASPQTENLTADVVRLVKLGAFDFIFKDQVANLPLAVVSAVKQSARTKSRPILSFQNISAGNEEALILVFDDSSALVDVSDNLHAVLGYSATKLKAIAAKVILLHPYDPDIYKLVSVAAESDQAERQKIVCKVKHKHGFWLSADGEARQSGNLCALILSPNDLKVYRSSNNQFDINELRYQQIVETAQEGIWIIDANRKTIFANQKLCDILGYEPEEMIGKHNYDFKDEAEKAITLQRMDSYDGRIETHESRFIHKNGKDVHCLVTTNAMFDADNGYIGRLAMVTDITQRRADEKAIKLSEANLLAIIENTTDLVYSLDTNFRFITYNQVFKTAIERVYGFEVKPAGNILEALRNLDPELAAKWEGIYKKAFAGEVQHYVFEYPFGDGKVFLSYSVNPIVESGRVVGLSCFSRDITKQKLDEAAIKKSAANVEAIIENSDADIYSLDEELRFITFNQTFKRSIKQSLNIDIEPGDSMLEHIEQVTPADADFWRDIYGKALRGQGLYLTKEFSIGGGKPIFLNFSINPIWENGKVTGLSCTARNITRQKLDELALKKSEARLRTIIDHIDMACVLLDNDLQIVSYNNIASELLKDLTDREIKEGDVVTDLIFEHRRDTVNNILNQTKNGTTSSYQVCHEVHGKERWFDVTWAGIENSDNTDFGYTFTSRDITENKKLELEKEHITNDLIKRNKVLEQFTYIISHNLRAPVANIMGLSSLLTGRADTSEEFNKIINSITRSGEKLDEVITDLNDILQINQDIYENIEDVLLEEIINDVKFSITHLIYKEKAKIVCDFNEAGTIRTLKTFIYSIFYNLILNSVKYRKPDVDPFIRISAKLLKNRVIISYQDNGRGIDTTKYANDIFGLYKRFDTTVEGKGMGLFMIKMQVESLGGSIDLKSTLNEGAEFTIELPQKHQQITARS